MPAYQTEQRASRPDYAVHPEAEFLFYAPFYRGGTYTTAEERHTHFTGMVYAPFVVKKLMDGVLSRENRHVGLSIADTAETIYNEHMPSEFDYDPEPLLTTKIDLPLYGRIWTFDIRSTQSFREAADSNQPLMILFGGIIIDSMLLMLFIMLSKANRQALQYADLATVDLARKTSRLEQSNEDLEQFAYLASHDLQEPLRTVGNYTQLLKHRYQGQIDEQADDYIQYAVDGVKRMQRLLHELLEYSRVDSSSELKTIDMGTACQNAINSLKQTIDELGAQIDIGMLPEVTGNGTQLTQLFQNLIVNALKYQAEDTVPCIKVSAEDRGADWCFSIEDNGIGIESRYIEKIFVMFQRLHPREDYEGTGVGLAICKKVIIRHGGEIWVESKPGSGSTFYFTLPKVALELVTVTPQGQSRAEGHHKDRGNKRKAI